MNGILYFNANDGGHGEELWRSDGTASGTYIVKDLMPGAQGSVAGKYSVHDNYFYFITKHPYGRLWKSDGTKQGTIMITDSSNGEKLVGLLTPFIASKNFIYFSSSTSKRGVELWKINQASNLATLVKNITPGPGSSHIDNLTDVNGTLFFTESGNNLWKSDGTAAGTNLVKEISPDNTEFQMFSFVNLNGELGFLTDSSYYYPKERTLWQSDGTSSGTHKVVDAGLKKIQITSSLIVLNNRLFFTANSTNNGNELWSGVLPGAINKSEENSIAINKSSLSISVAPNPFTNYFILSVNADKKQKAFISITDIQGKICLKNTYQINKGNNNIWLNTSALVPGTYIAQTIFSNGSVNSLQIVKQ